MAAAEELGLSSEVRTVLAWEVFVGVIRYAYQVAVRTDVKAVIICVIAVNFVVVRHEILFTDQVRIRISAMEAPPSVRTTPSEVDCGQFPF